MDKTFKYFDQNLPRFSLERYIWLFDELKGTTGDLLEIGSGDGKIIGYLSKKEKLNCYGVECVSNYRKVIPKELKGKIFYGSIVDEHFTESISKKFDYIIFGYVVHHLVGSSKSSSEKLLHKALSNSRKILKNNGLIIVAEPVVEPKIFSNTIFYLKKFFTIFSGKRIFFGNYWNNLGAPVVNFYGERELFKILQSRGFYLKKSFRKKYTNRFFKLIGLQRSDSFSIWSKNKK